MINHDPRRALVLRRGDRIAQLVIQRVEHAVFVEADELPGSLRGTGGHGSTGGAAALNVSETGLAGGVRTHGLPPDQEVSPDEAEVASSAQEVSPDEAEVASSAQEVSPDEAEAASSAQEVS